PVIPHVTPHFVFLYAHDAHRHDVSAGKLPVVPCFPPVGKKCLREMWHVGRGCWKVTDEHFWQLSFKQRWPARCWWRVRAGTPTEQLVLAQGCAPKLHPVRLRLDRPKWSKDTALESP
ncbi:phosphoribosylaminoimidazole carboxylase, ATPase subunit, partial [Trichinella spiralis]|uniref:phosphoribosylaminoimidazole carboxylase, ATPase subunit n=1 Tax=Trichinella spiralis TaxID=6334 RepID=UPI0001EFEBE9